MRKGSEEERAHAQDDLWARIERELQNPIPPPTGFAERVLAALSAEQQPGSGPAGSAHARPQTRPAGAWWLAAAGIAAALLAAFLVVSPRKRAPVSPLPGLGLVRIDDRSQVHLFGPRRRGEGR